MNFTKPAIIAKIQEKTFRWNQFKKHCFNQDSRVSQECQCQRLYDAMGAGRDQGPSPSPKYDEEKSGYGQISNVGYIPENLLQAAFQVYGALQGKEGLREEVHLLTFLFQVINGSRGPTSCVLSFLGLDGVLT